MMQHSVLSDTTPEGITTITLNRPEKHNAFNDDMIALLTDTLQGAIYNPETRVICLKGEGPNFSAGADLAWMQSMAKYSEAENVEDALDLAKLMHVLYYSPKPTIAQVQGKTFGGGIGLITCCHTAIVAEDAQFSFSEAKLGIIPAVISPFVINAIGTRAARHWFLQASPFDAQTALNMGLAHQVVPPDALENTVQRFAQNLLKNGPKALEAINHLVNDLSPIIINEEVMEYTARLIAKIRVSAEGQIGLNAFLNKTKPQWTQS